MGARVQMYKEIEEQKQRDKEELEAAKKFEQPPDVLKEARKKLGQKAVEGADSKLPRMRNLNKLQFKMEDDDENGWLRCVIEAPRHLATELIEADVHPRWFQILMKDKSLLLHTDHEIKAGQAEVRRIKSTGFIELILPKLHWKPKKKPKSKKGEGKEPAGGGLSDKIQMLTEDHDANTAASMPSGSKKPKGQV